VRRARSGGGEIAMTIEDLGNNEVLSWRERRLVAMGFDPERACEIARTTLDLYELEHLLGGVGSPEMPASEGCPLLTDSECARTSRRFKRFTRYG
jgi:hypothetical protein